MNLPQAFCIRMENYLKEEYRAFMDSYHAPHTYALRLNLLKYPEGRPLKAFPFALRSVPWAEGGYYVSYEDHPGKHPLHEAGAYYIQEPSAMSVVPLLSPAPGDIICDLCAAPGGKSTQIAAGMQGRGLLVANEIIPSRARILSENIERLGIPNAVITGEPPERMSDHFQTFFDKILIDAPCSGEGMFRKDETAIREWSPANVKTCAIRQKMILEHADRMLKPGGVFVYSTCTFSESENEEMILTFLEEHPNYTIENWQNFFPKSTGIISCKNLPEAMRLFPHKLEGEGHFAARLRKSEITESVEKRKKKKTTERKKPPVDYFDFSQKYLTGSDDSVLQAYLHTNANFQLFGNELYLVPAEMISLRGLKLLRAGLHLGTLKKNRFEPAHALAKASAPHDFFQSFECSYETTLHFLRGETVSCPSDFKGWTPVCYEGLPLGFGKANNGTLKNHYPKGLRKKL